MKVKDITSRHVTEDSKITNVDPSKKTVTYSDPQTNVSTTVPDTMVKPQQDGSVAVDTKAVGQAGAGDAPTVTVGANIKDVSTTESHGDDYQEYFHNWMNSEYAPLDDESGDERAVFNKAIHFAAHVLHNRSDSEFLAYKLSDMFHGSGMPDDLEEVHHDTIASGNHDVGGDPTDEFIDQVRDKKWERYPRSHSTKSPLSEKDELYKWLTIAGIK